jgi:hypothetical protein
VLLAVVLYYSTVIHIAFIEMFIQDTYKSQSFYTFGDGIIITVVSGIIALGSLAGILWIIIRKIKIRIKFSIRWVLCYVPLGLVFAAGVWCFIWFLALIATKAYIPMGGIIHWTLNGLIAYCFLAGIAVVCSSTGIIYIYYRRKAKKQENTQR